MKDTLTDNDTRRKIILKLELLVSQRRLNIPRKFDRIIFGEPLQPKRSCDSVNKW